MNTPCPHYVFFFYQWTWYKGACKPFAWRETITNGICHRNWSAFTELQTTASDTLNSHTIDHQCLSGSTGLQHATRLQNRKVVKWQVSQVTKEPISIYIMKQNQVNLGHLAYNSMAFYPWRIWDALSLTRHWFLSHSGGTTGAIFCPIRGRGGRKCYNLEKSSSDTYKMERISRKWEINV